MMLSNLSLQLRESVLFFCWLCAASSCFFGYFGDEHYEGCKNAF